MLYLSLGTNIGNKEKNLHRAVEQISSQIGEIVSLSSFVATDPWGFASPHSFLNCCVGVKTNLPPMEVLRRCQKIERKMGRTQKSTFDILPDGTKKAVYHDRIIDIDILLYDHLQLKTSQLTIPHPMMHKRLFVLQPLAEIAYDTNIPGIDKSVGDIFRTLATAP